MKKFISKIKKSCHKFMTGKKGFSLVELIVVIAIMAVMAAVLAPALLGYVEKSRMQKDDSAMDEVVNAIQLSLADQEIYDEVLEHSVWDNVSCYIDKKDESQFASHKITLKAANGDKKEQYMFGDEARLLDETVYYAAGNMRGLTITFSPLESGDTYDFSTGILNKFVDRNTGLLSENPKLYNGLRATIGDKLKITSQTYRNSDYTLFIRVGSTGGSEAVMQDAIQVWGQFNGTNLAEKDHKYELSSGRVVGSAGANDVTNNETNNNGSMPPDFSENAPVIRTMNITVNGEVKTYKYEEGMTWRDWVGSQYDPGNILTIHGENWLLHPTLKVGRDEANASLRYSDIRLQQEYNTYEDMLNSGESGVTSMKAWAHHKILPVQYYFENWGASSAICGGIEIAIIGMLENGHYLTGNETDGFVIHSLPTDIDSLPDWIYDWTD